MCLPFLGLVRLQTLLDNPIKLAQMPPELKLEVRAVHACSPTTEVAEARLIYYEKLKAGCCPYQSYLQDWQEKGLPICGHTYRDISTLGQWHALVEENNFGSVLHALAADVVRHSGESPRDICLNKLRSYALQAKKKGYTRLLVDTILQDAIEELQGPQVWRLSLSNTSKNSCEITPRSFLMRCTCAVCGLLRKWFD